jgi:Spy/CpxP family protein refolding chaperone
MSVGFRAGLLALIALAVVSTASVSYGQPGRGRGGFGGGFGGFGGGSSGLELIGDENVRKELDLVEDQVAKLREIGEQMRDDMRGAFEGVNFQDFRDLSEEEREARMAPIREKMQKVTENAQKEIDQVLLPHQRERLKQIVVQSNIRRQGTSGALTSGALADELKITPEQVEALRAKQQEVQEEMRKEIEQLQAEAREKVLSVLTAEQRAKLNSLMGNPIEFAPPQFGGFGGRGPGGPGGPGGRGPGGDNGGRLRRAPDGD